MSWSADLIDGALAVKSLPDRVRRATVLSLLDGLAVMAAAPRLEPSVAPFIDLAAAGGVGPATMLSGGSAPTALAAMANGALSHALDFEDTFDAAGLHPNAVAIPVLLALAEAEDVTFDALVTALAVGCDAACRIGLALRSDPADRGWYHPPMIAAAGAAVGAAHLLGLSHEQAVAAVSLTLVQFSLTDALKRSPGSDLRAVRDGLAARAVMDGVALARSGLHGTDDPLGADGLIGQLTGTVPNAAGDVQFLGTEVSLKSWPSCRGTHPAIAIALELRGEGRRAEGLETARFTLNPPDDMLFLPRDDRLRPTTAIMAKFSIPYTFAYALHHGPPGLHSFLPEARSDARVLDTAERIEMIGCDALAEPTVQLVWRAGTTETRPLLMPQALRCGEATLDDIAGKVSDCAALAHPAVHGVLALITSAQDSTSVRQLTAALRNA